MIESGIRDHMFGIINKIKDTNGKMRNTMRLISSTLSNKENKSKSTRINTVFTTMPMIIENRTKPGRYSFLRGLKKVFKNNDKENNWKNA